MRETQSRERTYDLGQRHVLRMAWCDFRPRRASPGHPPAPPSTIPIWPATRSRSRMRVPPARIARLTQAAVTRPELFLVVTPAVLSLVSNPLGWLALFGLCLGFGFLFGFGGIL